MGEQVVGVEDVPGFVRLLEGGLLIIDNIYIYKYKKI